MHRSGRDPSARAVHIGRAIAWGVGFLAVLVLGGWSLDIEPLKTPVFGTRAMVVSTAVMFGLLALALGLLADPDAPRWQRRVGHVAAALVIGAALTFLGEHTFALGLGIERILPDVDPALPAPETAVVFALLALALLVLDVNLRRGPVPSEVLALTGFGLTALVAMGHLYGHVFFDARLPIGMAVHTSAGLLASAVGIIAVRPWRGLAAIVASEHGGGALVRRLLVVSAIAVPAGGLLGIALQEAGVLPFPGAFVLGAAISLGVILAAILISGARISRVEAELQQWNEFVQAAPFGAVFGSADNKLVRVNDAFARMHGWTPEELVGRPIVDMFSPAARSAVPDQLLMVEHLGRYRFESEHVRRDGSVFPVVVDAAIITDERGVVVRRLAYVQDITDERRAREDQAFLASLVASADDAIVATDTNATVLSWNRGAEKLYGYTAEEMIGKSGQILSPPARFEERLRLVTRLAGGERIAGFETERRRKDGTIVPVSLTMSPIRGPHGIVGFAGIARDISARLAAERALAEAHADLERIERAALVVADAVAALPTLSLCRVLEVIAAQARDLTRACCAAVALVTRPDEAPRPCVSSGGPAARLGPVAAIPVRYRDELRGHIFVARRPGDAEFDARDRRMLEHLATHLGGALEIALLYEREAIERARLDATLAQIPEGVIVLDATGVPVHENTAAVAFRDVEGAPQPYDVRWPSGAPMSLEDLPLSRAYAHGETSIGVEVAIKVPGGELVPLLASASPIRVGDTRAGAVLVFRDIRALKALERMREEWTSVVAHDLRQPINAIRLAADVIVRTSTEPRPVSWGRRITGEVVRLDAMIADLLDASKLESHRMILRRELVRPVTLLEDALARVPALGARCEVRVESQLPLVLADPTRLLQVLGNLLSNAEKYGDDTAPIVLSLTRDVDGVRFSVTNHGPGIPADELATVFDRFTRTRAARASDVGGTGLGLYICKGLVEAHGGRIWVESVPGETTTFHVSIPATGTADAMSSIDDDRGDVRAAASGA